MDDASIKLKSVNSAVNPARIPEQLTDVIREVFAVEKDPYSILASYAYIFCGMTINDIRDMFILSDRYGTRKASREYVRQKVVNTFEKIHDRYRTLYGNTSLAATYLERNIDVNATPGVDLKTICVDEEEDIPDDEDIEKSKRKGKGKGKAKANLKADLCPDGSESWSDPGDRPGDEEPGVVDLESD